MKKVLTMMLAFCLLFSITACGSTKVNTESNPGSAAENSAADAENGTDVSDEQNGETAEAVELIVFAAASMTETMDIIAEKYMAENLSVNIVYNYDSSGTLLTQIQEGADCDIFISAAPKQMNALDVSLAGDEKNPDGLDFLLEGTRLDLLENKVVLTVPEGNPAGIESLDDMIEKVSAGEILLAIGNSDVPAGQYAQKIFGYYNVDEESLAARGAVTYGSNVKEVVTQVSEGAVDCGIVYATDAFSAGLETLDTASPEMCGQVIYPAAVLNTAEHEAEARAFLEYLQSEEASAVFESVGFTALS